MQKTAIEISWETIWKIIVAGMVVAAFFAASNVVITLLLSLVIATAFDGSVTFLEKKRVPRAVGTLLIFITTLTLLAVLLYIIVPLAVLELRQFLQGLSILSIPIIDESQAHQIFERIQQGLSGFIGALFQSGTSILGAVGYFLGNLLTVIVTIVLSFYFTISPGGVERFIRTVFPADKEAYVLALYGRVKKKMSLWFRGQLLLMLAVAALTFIGLTVLGVPYALILSIIAGLLEIVPVVGPVLSGALAFLVAAPSSITLGIYVAILFVAIQQLEAHLLVPFIMRRSLGLSPAVVIIALLVGNQFAGIAGTILAIPLTMVFQEWVEDFERDKAVRFARTKAGKLIEPAL